MDFKTKLTADMKAAMKSKEKERLSVIRMVLSDIKNQEIKEGAALDDKAVLTLLSRTAKQRKDSIDQFRKGERDDLVQKESRELEILLEYLPSQLTAEELRKVVEKAISESGAASAKEMGTVMKMVMADLSPEERMAKRSSRWYRICCPKKGPEGPFFIMQASGLHIARGHLMRYPGQDNNRLENRSWTIWPQISWSLIGYKRF